LSVDEFLIRFELKGFTKILLKKGETKTVTFEIDESDLAFYRIDMSYGTEPVGYEVYVGGNSQDVLETSFKLVE